MDNWKIFFKKILFIKTTNVMWRIFENLQYWISQTIPMGSGDLLRVHVCGFGAYEYHGHFDDWIWQQFEA